MVYGFLTVTAAIILAGGIGGLVAYYHFAQDLPPIDALKNYRPKTVTFFYSDDGRVIGEYSHERRIVVPLDKIPSHVQQAFIAAEDSNFYHHKGIDPISIVRAMVKNVEAGRIVQGASTITQQVTRSFLLSPEKKWTRKIREAILAYRISSNLTKDEVLYLYLNQIYLGHGAHGVESAAELYFDKHVDQLTIAEGALLGGLPQRPSDYSPFSQPKAARRRQVYTIGQMASNGFITQEQAEQALSEEMVFHERPNVNYLYTPYFTEEVRRRLEEKYGGERLYNDGLKVYTTVNIEMEAVAAKAVKQGLWEFAQRRTYQGPIKKLAPQEIEGFLKEQDQALAETPLEAGQIIKAVVSEVDGGNTVIKVLVGPHTGAVKKSGIPWQMIRGNALGKAVSAGDVILVKALDRKDESSPWEFSWGQEPRVQSALFSMDLADGAVKAMVGGKDFRESQFNRAVQSRRQPGSAFKPIIYTAAMENGFTPGSIIIDSPIVHDDFGSRRRWKPINYSGKFYGPTDLYTALTNSRNVVAIKLLNKVGLEVAIDYARRLGITSQLDPYLPLALGACGVSLEELVAAYTTFPNLGERVVPMYYTRVEDRDGRLLEEVVPVHIQAIEPSTACVMLSLLKGVVAHGTGTAVKPLGRPVAGKTGTTNDLTDAWFVGFTPEYATGVWVGLDEMKRMGTYESGGKAAAPIFLYYMREVLKDKPVRDFAVPAEGVTMVNQGGSQVCYKEGTVGTGISDVGGTGGDDFLKSEIDEKDL
jgi:penicillin-binding protein 1A